MSPAEKKVLSVAIIGKKNDKKVSLFLILSTKKAQLKAIQCIWAVFNRIKHHLSEKKN